MATTRSIQKVIQGVQTTDGAGVNLTRIIGGMELNMLDPFLLLDEFGSDNPKDYLAGFPPHPHRGFETITYMLNGKFRHKDSAGNEGYLTDGSVQWMTAGRGVIHSEMPEQTEGLVRGFQLWLNLPKDKKMIDPAYNDIPAERIPTFIYIYEGSVRLDREINQGHLIVFNQEGKLDLTAGKEGAKFIVVAGEPLNEPVARGGPFVMNSKGEVLKAFEDYQNGILDK